MNEPKVGIWYRGSLPPSHGYYWVVYAKLPGMVYLDHYKSIEWSRMQRVNPIVAWARAVVPPGPDKVDQLPEWKG